jgi:hypothetical protein
MPPFAADPASFITAVELSQIVSFFVGSLTGIAFVMSVTGRNY